MAQKKPRNRRVKPVEPEERSRRGLLWGGVAVAAVAMGSALLYFSCRGPHSYPLPEGEKNVALAAHYVGSTACVACHGKEAAEWRQSQHHDAMAEASDQSVRGNFNDAKFTYSGITSTFSKRDGKFLVNTDGRDGKLHDFEVKYTFGVYPLQQYLIEFPDGRLQALSIAWDARPKKEGGQRWFHLYPKERITYDDELHWTRPAQNWNFMCADCHSTDVRKNYDPVADRFQTRWAEISVGCEACHGPGSRHLEWAKSQIPLNPLFQRERNHRADDGKGLSARLDERRDIGWSINATTGNASRSKPRATEREIEVCAQCHGRRSQIAEGYEAGKPFLDYYLWQGCLPDAAAAFYFSAGTYTTVGSGDLVLAMPWRLLGPIEALTGVLMCGLSTGYFFVVVSYLHQSRLVKATAISNTERTEQ